MQIERKCRENADEKEDGIMEYKIVEKEGKVREDQNYLICEMDEGDEMDLTSYWMQDIIRPSWLIPMQYVTYEGKNSFCYDLEGLRPLDITEITSSKERFLDTLIDLCDIVTEAERHLIGTGGIIWDLNYIYESEKGVRVIEVPVSAEYDRNEGLRSLICNLMITASPEIRQQNWYASISDSVSGTGYTDYKEFKKFLYQHRMERTMTSARTGQTIPDKRVQEMQQRARLELKQREEKETAVKKKLFFGRRKKEEKQAASSGQTGGNRNVINIPLDEEGFGETVVLRAI